MGPRHLLPSCSVPGSLRVRMVATAVVVVAGVLSLFLVDAPEVEAAGGWYDWVSERCGDAADVPAALFGSATGGALAYVAGPTGASGLTSASASAAGSGTFLGAVGSGGALVTGGQVAAAVGVFAAGFCAPILVGNALTGYENISDLPTYTGPLTQILANAPCGEIDFAEYGTGIVLSRPETSMCWVFALPPSGFSYVGVGRLAPSGVIRNNFSSSLGGIGVVPRLWVRSATSLSFSERTQEGSDTEGEYAGGVGGGLAVVEVDCFDNDVCTLLGQGPSPLSSPSNADGQTVFFTGTGTHTPNQSRPMTGPALQSGPVFWYESTSTCVEAATGGVQTLITRSLLFRGPEGQPVPDNPCVAPFIRTGVRTDLWTPTSVAMGGASAGTDLRLSPSRHRVGTVQEWTMPAAVQQSVLIRQCILAGFTNCDAAVVNGDSVQVTNTQTQQTTTVFLGPGVSTAPVAESLNTVIATQPGPPTAPTTVPTTTLAPTTVPSTTAAPTTVPPAGPTTIPPAGPDPVPPGPPLPPTDGDWNSCMTSRLAGAWDGVNLNPVTWVRAILTYVVVPIMCALIWLFVPTGGWSAAFDGMLAPVRDSDLYLSLAGLWTTVDLSGCTPLQWTLFGASTSIDVGLCGNLAISAIWIVLIGLGVLGLASSVLTSLSEWRKRPPVYAQGELF